MATSSSTDTLHASPFVISLFEILTDKSKYGDIIRWNESGMFYQLYGYIHSMETLGGEAGWAARPPD